MNQGDKMDLMVGLIGCGSIAQRYADSILNVVGLNLIAVADSDIYKAQKMGIKYGAYSVNDYRKLLTNPELDFIIVCTPNGTHAQIASDVINSGKHVLVEKPIAMKYSEALDLINLSKDIGLRVFCMHQYRYRRNIEILYSKIRDGALGEVRLCNLSLRWNRSDNYYTGWKGTKKLDGGVLLNQAIHFIDILELLVGPVNRVFSFSTKVNKNIEAPDTFVAALHFMEGFLGTLEVTTAVVPRDIEASISIFTDEISLKIGGTHLNKFEWFETNGKYAENEFEFSEFESKSTLFKIALIDICNAIKFGHSTRIDGEKTSSVMKTIDALSLSSSLDSVAECAQFEI